jgi:putative phosphoesterase
MALAVVSDTHLPRGRRRLPEACLERLRGADLILHAGDLVALAVLEELERLGPPVVAVHGNVDEPAVVERLPVTATVETLAGPIALLHDAGPSRGRLARLRRRFPEAAAVVFGHSHIPLHEREGEFQIFNPGSPTDRRRQPRHTMGLVHPEARGLRFELVELD